MNAKEIVKGLREMLPPKVDYAKLVGAEGFSHGQHYVWEDPEPYIISAAADLIESQKEQIGALSKELDSVSMSNIRLRDKLAESQRR